MPEMPMCPLARERSCPRSHPVIVKQTADFCTFQCHTCGTVYVETFTRYDDAAKHENYLKFLAAEQAKQREYGSRRRYFT